MKIEVYGRNEPPCTYCEQTKALLNAKGLEYSYFAIGENVTKDELLEIFPGARTVPQILIDGKAIGGFTELKKFIQ